MRAHSTFLAGIAAVAYAQTAPGFSPSTNDHLQASYGTRNITPGLNIPRNATLSAPSISSSESPAITILIDLDAPYPNNATYAPFLHWLVYSNGSASASVNASSPVPYVAPDPPKDSPEHRYVILSYTRVANTTSTFTMPRGFENVGKDQLSRARFDLESFVDGAGLRGPRAANWFTVSPERDGTGPKTPEQFEGAAARVHGGMLGAIIVVAGMIVMAL